MNRVLPHQHCEVCGKVVEVEVRFCGPECVKRYEEAQKEKKKWMWIILAAVVAFMIFINAMRAGVL